jgi:hypothetical protein
MSTIPEYGYFTFCQGEHMVWWDADESESENLYSIARRKWFETLDEAEKEIANPRNGRSAIIIPAKELVKLNKEWYRYVEEKEDGTIIGTQI